MRAQGRLLSGLSPEEAALLFGALLRALAMKQCGPLSFGGRWGCGWPLAQTPWAVFFCLHGGRGAFHVRAATTLAEPLRGAGQVAPELALALDPRLGLASQFVNVLLFDFVKCAHTGPLVRGIAR